MEQKREHWGSRWGFILATMGSAVGLGNIWRFSYAMGSNGGSAFLIIYLLSVILIGFPVMLIEFSIGRRGQDDAVQSFKKIAPNTYWYVAGGLGVLAAFLILSFYGIIGGWSLRYTFEYLAGGIAGDSQAFFLDFIAQPVAPIFWSLMFMGLTVVIVLLGVQKGIEKSSKWMMPILSLLVIGLAVYSLTLGGTAEAFAFMFQPEWSAFTDPDVYIAALGQAFFTLSLGMGIMLTYGSYLKPEERLTSSAAVIILLDTGFALVSGLMIFPALFAFGLDPTEGAGLVFIVLPVIFEALGGIGVFVGLLFFVLLSIAALSSSISLLEVSVAFLMDRVNMTRKGITLLLGTVIFLLGIPSSLSQGAMEITVLGSSFLDFMDLLTANVLLPSSALLSVLFVAWTWSKEDVFTHTDLDKSSMRNSFYGLSRFFAPVAITLVLGFGVFNWLFV
ncbi:neurotransmitter:Na+ symporter, NSS family [Alkalibacterium subtropicum]|uniref:Neurotransmitter:Na+ symporter, NSS family n=1 Tax=Alkalibacterium subtropicum TaxID=753702 RepID=A0A1I1GMB6_9LACT|nr:sodium-dependent transporter [Alkalibacterium subtropicum]SFC12596.1 neurotransmitter:Na+ symporter, NSS family [Alkalibacterium subtropicum]